MLNTRLKTRLAVTACVLLFGGVLVVDTSAKQQTLLNSTTIKLGGFGGPAVYYTSFLGEDAVMAGGQGALLVNDFFYLGGSGYGVASIHSTSPYANPEPYPLDEQTAMGYGGGTFGVILANERLLHIATDFTVGRGTLVYSWQRTNEDGYGYRDDWAEDHDAFTFTQPMAHLELNVTDWFRILGSVGYRYTHGVNLGQLDDDDTSGPVAGLSFRFGWYR